MNFTVKIVYMDGKDINVLLPQDKAEEFLTCIKSGAAFWEEKQKQAFWTNLENIRYLQVLPAGDENGSVESNQSEGISGSDQGAQCDSRCSPAPDQA